MQRVLDLIEEYGQAVVLYDRHIPHAAGDWRAQLIQQRTITANIIRDLWRLIRR
jgi:hypothetical protein